MPAREADVPARREDRPWLLALDTATTWVVVAVGRCGDGEGGAITGRSIPTDRRHAEVLVPTIRSVLGEAGVPVEGIGAIGAGVGPGLFTGLRVGVTTARTMAWALEVPVVAVSSLAVLAAALPRGRVVAVDDARRGEVFWAAFDHGDRSTPDAVATPEGLAELLDPPVTLVGAGAERYREVLEGPGVQVAEAAPPDPATLWGLAAALVAEEPVAPSSLVPNYLRRTDAEIARDRRGT